MRLEYSLTFTDLFLLSASRLSGSFTFAISQALVSAFFAAMIGRDVFWHALVIFVVLFSLSLILSALVTAYALSRKPAFLQSRSLRIDDQGLIESNGNSETLLAWNKVRKMHSGIGILNIHYGTRGRVLTVPARAFKTRDEMRLFYHTVMQNSHAARV